MNPTVLVVDDMASVRLCHISLLRRKGYLCIAACDGVEALEKLRTQVVNLVLLDLMMPNLDGDAFIAQVRAMPSLAALPILVVTSEASPDWIKRHSGPGGVSVLSKPLTPADLLRGVQLLMPPGEGSPAAPVPSPAREAP
jgi:two-component system chemotaxis response regulator CheY